MPPITMLEIRFACQLCVGDVVALRHDLTTDLIDVEILPCGLVRLRYGVDDADAVIVPGSAGLMVYVG